MNNLTPRARQALALALEEAVRLGHKRLDSEHILLGILALDQGVVVHVLRGLGVSLDSTRIQVEEMTKAEPSKRTETEGVLSPSALHDRILRHAATEAKRMGHSYTGTEHLLLGLMREEEGIAAKVLKSQRLDLEKVRREVLYHLNPDADVQYAGREIMAVRDELKGTREELSKKIDSVIAAFNALKSEFAQLRTDLLKGSS